MKNITALLDQVLSDALSAVRRQKLKIFTIAFYHDHESGAVSVCVDTLASSRKSVAAANAYSLKYFWPAVESGDLEDVALWNANIGRSLSLGDFRLANLARAELPRGRVTRALYQSMLEVMHAREEEMARLADSRDLLLFCCSGPDDEVQFTWSASPKAQKRAQPVRPNNVG